MGRRETRILLIQVTQQALESNMKHSYFPNVVILYFMYLTVIS